MRDPESVADHSWGTAFLCLLFAEAEEADLERSLAMAAVHDLAESVTGDVATRVHPSEQGVSAAEKQASEAEAMAEIVTGFGDAGADFYHLWREYEAAKTKEAVFVRDMNLIDMCLQALLYEREGRYTETPDNPNFKHFRGLDEFFATSGPRIQTKTARKLFREVRAEYMKLRK